MEQNLLCHPNLRAAFAFAFFDLLAIRSETKFASPEKKSKGSKRHLVITKQRKVN